MGGVQTYALLCESLLGQAPAEVRLLYLRQPIAISSVAIRTDHPRPAPARRRRLVRHRAGLRRRGLPPPRRPAVQPLPLQDLLPRLRRVNVHAARAPSTRRSTPPSSRSGAGPRSTVPPPSSPTWPTTGSSGCVLAGLKARRRGPDRRRAVVALAAAGFSSLLVSRVVKAAVERQRPEDHLDASVRTPTSSSFPSGHTLAAFCTAFVLGDSDSRDGRQRGFRRRRGGQPGPPAGPSPHRRDRGRRHRLGARTGPAPRSSTSSRPAAWVGAAGAGAGRQGNAPCRRRVEQAMKPVRRHLGLPLPLRPQRPRAPRRRLGRTVPTGT